MIMAAATVTSSTASVYYTHCCCHPRPPKKPAFLFFNPIPKPTNHFSLYSPMSLRDAKKEGEKSKEVKEEEVAVEEELPWIQEKALDLVEFTGSVTQAIPGPRVGHSSFSWFLAVPLAYFGITFVFAVVKAVRKS